MLTIRPAQSSDAEAVARLAALHRRAAPRGQALVAERDGAVVAAVAVGSGSLVADPARPTADAVSALRLRRYQLLRMSADVAPLRALLRRLAPAW